METAHQAALHHAWDSVWADEWRGRDGLIVDDEHRITGAEAPDQTPRVAQAANDGAGRADRQRQNAPRHPANSSKPCSPGRRGVCDDSALGRHWIIAAMITSKMTETSS